MLTLRMLKYGVGALALVSFGVFFANIVIGSLAGNRFLSDLMEVAMLGITCVLFVIMINLFEQESSKQETSNQESPNGSGNEPPLQ